MTDSALREQRDASLALLDRLIRRGRELQRRSTQSSQSSQSQEVSALAADVRMWQNDCAAATNELSGGSKAHWLSRAFSSALMVRGAGGGALLEANPAQILSRILDVLQQGEHSLATLDSDAIAAAGAQPRVRQFEFVHDPALRPVLEEALAESGRAFESGDYERALKTTCGILEAIITDALQKDRPVTPSRDVPLGDETANAQNFEATVPAGPDGYADRPALDWTFDQRIAAAEQARLIRGGCARLTPTARGYRDAAAGRSISQRDARIAAQVLRVVMRDLAPGR